MNAHQLLKAIADDADATGCDGCYVVSAEHIRAALEFVRDHPEPQTPRILVHRGHRTLSAKCRARKVVISAA